MAERQQRYTGVRPTPAGKIEIYFRANGKDYYETLDLSPTVRNLAAASRRREQLKARAKAGLPPEETAANPRVATVAQRWLDACRDKTAPKLKTRTIEGYKQILNTYWLPTIADIQVSDLRYGHLRDRDNEIKWTSNKTRKNAHSPLRMLCEYIEGGTYSTHGRLYRFERVRPRKTDRGAYSEEERDMLLDWLKNNAKDVVYMYYRVGFGTGMRSAEMIGLTWPKYDGQGFLVNESIQQGVITSTKTHTERYVPVGQSLRDELGEFKVRQTRRWGDGYARGYLFLNQYGRPYTRSDKLQPWFRQACKATGIRYLGGKHKPYPWRHTFVTLAIENSLDSGQPVDLVTLADTTGHSVDVMMRIYRQLRKRRSYDHHLNRIGDL